MTLQRKWCQRFLLIIASGAVFLDVPPAAALEPYAAKPQEIALMPDYCQAKIGGPTFASKAGDWPQRFGDLYLHLHHYCEGLKFMQRAARAGISKEDRSYDLNTALSEFDYVLHAAPPGHWFLPEIHLKKATVYSKLGRQSEAAAEYQQIREGGQR